MTKTADILIVGGGMAGASLGYFLAEAGARALVLEREEQPGYHSTGRSAAMFLAGYGPPAIRKLSLAGLPFFENPPEGFSEAPILSPRGVVMGARGGEVESLAALVEETAALGAEISLIDEAEARRLVPILRPGLFASASYEPDGQDMDVGALHHGFLRGFRAKGGTVETRAEVEALSHSDGAWRLETRRGEVFEAPLVVNAAGAWADELAGLAGLPSAGLTPKRRTAFMLDLADGRDPGPWPLFATATEDLYFKPDAGRLLVSPADKTPVAPQDVQPEELDIAIALDRFEQLTTLPPSRPQNPWAGLRTFAEDGDPVVGFETRRDAPAGFFWLAGQGGYGIQTSAGLGRLAADLVLGRAPDPALSALGFDPDAVSPARLGI